MTETQIPAAVQARVRADARDRYGYCLTRQQYAMQVLEIEHIMPRAAGASDDEENLWLACRLCNNAKGIQTHARDPLTNRLVRLFNPRSQNWDRPFCWIDGNVRVKGRTVCGRATVEALNLNNEIALVVRQNWVKAGWHPPED
jgi:hypothetical protein